MVDWNVNSYIRALWRWCWLIAIVTIVAAVTGLGVSAVTRAVYRATATLMTGDSNTNPRVTTEDYVLGQRLAAGYSTMARRQPIIEAAIQSLGIAADWRVVQDNVVVATVPNTTLMEIRVSDTDPRRAAALANEIGRQLILASPTLSNQRDLEQRRAFVQGQLDALQANMVSAEARVRERQQALDHETSARVVMELKDDIKAEQTKIADWRAEYTKLVAALPDKSPSTLTVVEPADTPTRPVSPNVLFNVLLAGVAGFLLSCSAVIVTEYLKAGKVRSMPEAAEAIGTVTLGSIEYWGKKPRGLDLVAVRDPDSRFAEAFRVLRTNVRFAWAGSEPIMLLVTSPGVGEGKSAICANLAASFAQSGKRTILVDADLRHAHLGQLVGIEQNDGLSALLRSYDLLQHADDQWLREWTTELVAETTVPNLWVLPAGKSMDVNPGELLASSVMGRVLDVLRATAEVVILDSPPVLPVADATILGSLPVAVVLVAEAERTTTKAMSLAYDALLRAQARVLGCVLNKTRSTPPAFYQYMPPYGRSAASPSSAIRLPRRA